MSPAEKRRADELEDALATLIVSTLSKKRPVALTEVSRCLSVAESNLGGISNVATRLGLSTKMLRQFYAVEKLAPPVKHLFKERIIDSVDAAVHLAQLSSRDQLDIAESLGRQEINTADVRAIVQLKRSEPSVPIKKITDRINSTKNRREYIVEFAIKGRPGVAGLRKIFGKYFDENSIATVEIDGYLGRLVLTECGNKRLGELAKEFGVPKSVVIAKILR